MKNGLNNYDLANLTRSVREGLAMDMAPDVAWDYAKQKHAGICAPAVLESFKAYILKSAGVTAPEEDGEAETPEPPSAATASRRRGRPRKQPLQDAPESTERTEQLEDAPDPEPPAELVEP